MFGSLTTGLLSVLLGAVCFYASRSNWYARRMDEKFADAEDVEKRKANQRRDWTIISVLWVLLGLAQLLAS